MRIMSPVLAAALVATLVANRVHAQGSSPTDIPTARPIGTPGGTRVFEYNDCLVIEIQSGSTPPEDIVSDFCGSGGGRGSPGYAYGGWLPDFLAGAIITAEEALCGRRGCALGSRAVRVYVTWGMEPAVRTIRTDDFVTIYMTSVIVDLVETTAIHYMREAQGQRAATPYSDWLAHVASRSAAACDPMATGDRRPTTQEEFLSLRAGAQMFYAFLFAHELAHLRNEAGCPEEGTTLAEESACDAVAFARLMARDVLLPTYIVAPMVSLAHYQRALGPILTAPGGAGHDYSEQFVAARWQPRASAILDGWAALCEGGTPIRACGEWWRDGVERARRLVTRPLPTPCDPSLPRREAPVVITSRTCIYVLGPRIGEVEFLRDRQPYALGASCGDNAGNVGFLVRDGTTSMAAPHLTVTCRFETGPRAGQTQWFPRAPPLPVGAACTDGRGSWGIAVDGSVHHVADLTRTCRFESGPLAGAAHSYPVPPIAVGMYCTDGRGNEGHAVPDSGDTATVVTQTCRFTSGPRAGTTQWFPDAVPFPIGAPCWDPLGSSGTGVADEPRTIMDLSRTCRFYGGPAAGSTSFMARAVPTVVGAVCVDGIASVGLAVPDAL